MFSKKKTIGIAFAGVLGLGISAAANAALVDRGGGLIFDDDLNITWQANANLAATNTFGVSGISTTGSPAGIVDWPTAQSWIAAMNTANYLGYSDWRLPTTLQPDATCAAQVNGNSYGKNCTGSEMGHLFYTELGGVAWQDITTTHNTNYDLFQNIRSGAWFYLSGTEYAPNTLYAWDFSFGGGQQQWNFKTSNYYAWAVRSGDVSAVPVPAAVWLFGSGLLGLIGVARRKAGRNA